MTDCQKSSFIGGIVRGTKRFPNTLCRQNDSHRERNCIIRTCPKQNLYEEIVKKIKKVPKDFLDTLGCYILI